MPVRNLLSIAAVLVLMGSTSLALADTPPIADSHGVPVSALTGLELAAVRARLSDVPVNWPDPPVFQVATATGQLSFVTVGELMTDPVLAQRMANFRTHGDPVQFTPYLKCEQVLLRKGGSPEPASSVVLVFLNGRLDAAFQPIEAARPSTPALSDQKAMLAYIRRPQTSPFVANLGELPLEDGLGFLSRWTGSALSPSDALSNACAKVSQPLATAPPRGHALDASDMQGLALLPFSAALPLKNQQRVAARKTGAALMASLRLGELLGAPPQKFAARHTGVRAFLAKSGDYAVLSIDMGGYPGRNLTNFNDATLIGVRSGSIEWISPPTPSGPGAPLLCLDGNGVPNTPRAGCTGWGHFSP